MNITSFAELALADSIRAAVDRQGYSQPTPIQAQAIPLLMNGHDLIGTAQTGTGKTAAFILPLLDSLLRTEPLPVEAAGPAAAAANDAGAASAANSGRPSGRRSNGRGRDSRRPNRAVQPARPRALILAPTRELALQIGESISDYGRGSGLSHTVIFGGAPKPSQAAKLRGRPAILAATPGRLMDFVGEGLIDLSGIEIFVLDEADRMLDMGFVPEVRRIAAMAPRRNQTVLFSATMPPAIEKLAQELLTNPERVAIAPKEVTVDRIQQSVLHMKKEDKVLLLPEMI